MVEGGGGGYNAINALYIFIVNFFPEGARNIACI